MVTFLFSIKETIFCSRVQKVTSEEKLKSEVPKTQFPYPCTDLFPRLC